MPFNKPLITLALGVVPVLAFDKVGPYFNASFTTYGSNGGKGESCVGRNTVACGGHETNNFLTSIDQTSYGKSTPGRSGICGQCYEVEFTHTVIDENKEGMYPPIVVEVHDSCPNQGNEEWCAPAGKAKHEGAQVHFDLCQDSKASQILGYPELHPDWDSNPQFKGKVYPSGLGRAREVPCTFKAGSADSTKAPEKKPAPAPQPDTKKSENPASKTDATTNSKPHEELPKVDNSGTDSQQQEEQKKDEQKLGQSGTEGKGCHKRKAKRGAHH